MKDKLGWTALAIFASTCWVVGSNRLLMKSLNVAVVGMLAVSVVLVLLLNGKGQK
jgi:hypothetical protein